MKKIISIAVVVMMAAALCLSAAATVSNHFIDEAVLRADEKTWALFGWTITDVEMKEVGYKIDGGQTVWTIKVGEPRNDAKEVGDNDAFIDRELEGVVAQNGLNNGLENAKSYRIRITVNTASLEKGSHTIQVVAKYADGTEANPFRTDEFTINKTTDAEAPATTDDAQSEPADTDPQPSQPTNPPTADVAVIAVAAVACVALAGAVVAKKVK